MPLAPVRDLHLYYELHGSGPPLLAISGTGGDLRVSAPELWPLNADFTVAHYDQRGLGRTSKPDRAYTMAEYADDAVGLLDELGWAEAHVVGTSFGGMVAQHVALRHPERVDRLVLACTSSGGAGGSSADLLALDDLPADDRARIGFELVDVRSTTPGYELPAVLERYLAARASAPAPDPDAVRGARRQLEARADHDTWDELPHLSPPTLVIGGRHDGIAPPENIEALAERIPAAQLAFFEGGHAFMIEDPTCWTAIRDFLRAG